MPSSDYPDYNKRLVRFDWAIKRLLRHKTDHTILNGFLTSLLGKEIRIEKILESEGNKEYEENKSNRVDVLAETSDGKKIIIEIQNETEDSYFHRMLFGTSKTVNEFLKSGQGYGDVSKVYSINIVYFKLGEGSDYVYHGKTEFRGLHDNDVLELSPKLKEKFRVEKVYEIFPEYYILKANDFNKLSKVHLDQWIYFLSNSRLPDNADAPGLREAERELRVATLTPELKRDYDRYIDNMRSLEDVVDSAWSSGHFEGKAEGREEGRAEGREEEKWNNARKMHSKGFDIETINEITGLPLDELKAKFK